MQRIALCINTLLLIIHPYIIENHVSAYYVETLCLLLCFLSCFWCFTMKRQILMDLYLPFSLVFFYDSCVSKIIISYKNIFYFIVYRNYLIGMDLSSVINLGGEDAMSLPATMSFGNIFAYTDPITNVVTTVTTSVPAGATYLSVGKYDLPDGWAAGELPFRTFVMLIGLVTQILVTELTHYLFVTSRKLSLSKDFLNVFTEG